MRRERLSAVVLTLNEETHLGDCLDSLAFADEVVVLDSYSTDRTREVASSRPGVQFWENRYAGDGPQRNWAIDRAAGPWVLLLDADERIPPALASEIERAVLCSGTSEPCFALRRENVFLGRVIRHAGWGHDQVVRLVRKGAVRYPEMRVHAEIRRPSIRALSAPMRHLTFRSLTHYAEKMQAFARRSADDLIAAGRRATFADLLLRPAWRFVRQYLIQAGILDGRPGLILCAFQAYGTFLKWALVWESERSGANAAARDVKEETVPGAKGG
jgi:glycosyltransferase involved in cell wall biosynthesis